MKKLAILSALFSFMISMSLDAQDIPDWAWKSPLTKVYPTGEYYNLPQAMDNVTYQNPNTETRVVNEGGQLFILPPNVRPFPHTATQSEVDAASMKGNTNVLYASWNSYGPSFYGTGFCYSSNGGTTWTGSHQTFTPNSGDPGPWIWPAGSTWAGRLGLSVIQGAGYSTNGGTNWTFAMNFSGASSFDKNLSAVDDISGSPFFGRAYTVWTNFGGTFANRIVGSYSTDGGVTWSAAAPVSPVPASGHHQQGCDVEVGPGGVVICVWGHCTTNGQNSTEDQLGFARSTDGGVTWIDATNTAVEINGIRASNLFNGIRSNGFPRLAIDNTGGSRNGWIYVAIGEKNIAPATDVADMCLSRSTNNGVTWTHTRINQDAPANGKYQYMGDIDVAPDASVVCCYYDQRNTTTPVTEYWLSRSTDGGNTWVDVAVSDHTFNPVPISGLATGYQGDYTGITCAAGKVWPFWADNSSGTYQVWTEGITIGSGSGTGPDYLYYKFENNPNSSTVLNCAVPGVGTPTAPLGAGTPLNTGGQFDTCISGTGLTTGGVTTGWNCNLAASSWTISMWITIPTTTNIGYLFGDAGSSSFRCFHNGVAGADNLLLRFTPTGGGTDEVLVTGIGPSPTVVTFVYDSAAAQVRAYKNGVLAATVNRTTNFPAGSGFKVGGYSTSASFSGKMDEFRLYRRALTPAEVLSQWNQNLTGCGIVLGNSNNNKNIPGVYSLSQNFPNPFNPATKISFGLPKAGNISLIVYDLLGKEVTVIANEYRAAGNHEIEFNASNLSSGVYFYRLSSGDFSDIKKMVLVK